MTLTGPADADRFRVKVGRYGDRWYIDPLPACELATDGPMAEPVPAVSIVKNAWPKFLTAWAAREAAICAVKEQSTWSQMEPDAAVTYIAGASNRSRDKAANRGSAVHAALEALAQGADPSPLLEVDAGDYLDACRQVIADLQPTPLMCEAVAISRTAGYGGTLDAIWRVGGEVVLFDFKSKAPGKHGAWPDEMAQLAAYANADYLIVEEAGRARRVPVPPLDRLVIVSIEPGSYRCYPADVDGARNAWTALLEFWKAQQSTIVGHPLMFADPPGTEGQAVDGGEGAQPGSVPPPSADVLDWLKARAKTLVEAGHGPLLARSWPDAVPTFKFGGPTSTLEASLVEQALIAVEREVEAPFPPPRPGDDTPPPDDDPLPPAAEHLTRARALLDEYAPDEARALLQCVTRGGHTNVDQLHVEHVRRLEVLCTSKWVGFTYDELIDGTNGVTVFANEAQLLERHGTKRACLEVAKRVAADLGIPRPSKFDEIVGEPCVVVAVLAEPPATSEAA